MTQATKEDLTNKLLTGAIVGLLSWNIWTTHQLSINVAVLSEKVEQLERSIHNESSRNSKE